MNIIQKGKSLIGSITNTVVKKFNPITQFIRKLLLAIRKFNKKRKIGTFQSIDKTTTEHVCKNCKATFVGKYCYNCGQDANTHRLTWSSVLDNILGGLTNIARGFGRTILELFSRPGYMIQDFIKGKRVIYAKPFQMLFVLAAIYAVSYSLIYPESLIPEKQEKENIAEQAAASSKEKNSKYTKTVNIDSLINSSANKSITKKEDDKSNESLKGIKHAIKELKEAVSYSLKSSPYLKAIWELLYSGFTTNKALSAILILPFIALAARLAFFRRKAIPRLNYIEFLFIVAYMECQNLIITTLSLPFSSNDDLLVIKGIISIWTFKELFGRSIIKTILKYILLYIYLCLIFILLAAIVVAILLLIAKFTA